VETARQKEEGRLLDVAWQGILLEISGTNAPARVVRIPPELVRHIDAIQEAFSHGTCPLQETGLGPAGIGD
jgi:hypothetical protein